MHAVVCYSPQNVIALGALASKIAASDHLFGGALTTKAARYKNFLSGGLPTNRRSWITLDRWRWSCTRTGVSVRVHLKANKECIFKIFVSELSKP